MECKLEKCRVFQVSLERYNVEVELLNLVSLDLIHAQANDSQIAQLKR